MALAKRVISTTEYTDDITGGKADSTLTFAINGTTYEIDLSRSNARAFEKAIQAYIEAGRKVRGARRKPYLSWPGRGI